MKIKTHIILLFLSLGFIGFAQQKQVETSVDSTRIRIGSKFHLVLKTKVDTSSVVLFPKEQYFGALEVLEDYPTDTILDKKNRTKYELIKKYGLTQFDSGKYVIPQLKVLIDNKPFLTDSVMIEVANVEVDTLKQPLFDIKDVIADYQKSSMKWWLWLFIGLGIAGAGIVVFLYWKKNQTLKPRESKIIYTPIEKATIGLKKLEEKQLIEKGAIKDYYSELTDIARTYLEEAVKIPAMENTTAELIENLRKTAIKRKLAISDEIVLSLEKVLKQADLVKFAKSKPLEFEIIEDRNTVEKTLRTMHGIIPLKTPEEEEAERNEELRLELERKRRKKKMISNISFVIGVIMVIGLAYWMATSGISTIKNKFFGSPTTEFLTSEWITSEYGNPPVRIETPKVLIRKDISSSFTPQVKQEIKEHLLFTYGELFKDFLYVSVNTTKLNTEVLENKKITEEDTAKYIDRIFAEWEVQGAKNILTQRTEFTTLNGTPGVKIFGSFDYLDVESKNSKKIYYESLVFQHTQGFIHIVVHIDDDDVNKKEITDRIINSVELIHAK